MPPTDTTQDTEIELKFPAGAVRMLFPPSLSSSSHPSSTAESPTSPIAGVDASYIITNIIPPQSNFAVLPHWHESYTEHFRVARGYVLLRLGQRHIIVGPDDGDIAIRPGVIHGFCRADISISGSSGGGDEKGNGGSGGGLDMESADRAWRSRTAQDGKPGPKSSVDERNGTWTSEDVLLYEWTTPADGHKEVFFRNMLSYTADHLAPVLHEIQGLQARRQRAAGGGAGGLLLMVQWVLGMLLVVAKLIRRAPKLVYSVSHMDTYLLLVDDRYGKEPSTDKAVDGKEGEDGDWGGPSEWSKRVTYALFAVINVIGKLAGWRVWREEYTPGRLREVAKRTMG